MPYVRKGKCVHKQNPDGSAGEQVGCSDSVEEAKKHLAALYANVPDASKEVSETPSPYNVHGPGGILSEPGQTGPKKKKKKKVENAMIEPNGVETKESSGEAKGTSGHGGYLVTDDTGSHLPTKKNGKIDHGLMGAAWAALHGGFEGNKYQGSDASGALAKLRKLYASEGIPTPSTSKEFHSEFTSTKEADGHYRWVLITGSAFKDRDREIIAEKAFGEDCDEMDLTGDYGELLWYHCDGELHADEKEMRPYIPLGSCDLSLVQDKLNYETGLYYDDEVGRIFTEKAAEFGASKAFWHLPDEPVDGVYTYIRTKERSLLPRTKEANLLTRLFGHKEKAMASPDERIAALKEKLGADEAEQLLATGKAMSEKASLFLESKEMKKTKADDAEDAADAGDDEAAEGETPTTKKKAAKGKETAELLVAFKEYGDKMTALVAEQKEAAAVSTAATEKEISAIREDVAQMQQAYALLMGIQPGSVFKASEKGKVRELKGAEKTAADKVDEAAGIGDNFLAGWIISGERPAAA